MMAIDKCSCKDVLSLAEAERSDSLSAASCLTPVLSSVIRWRRSLIRRQEKEASHDRSRVSSRFTPRRGALERR
jgi:hypothetical protein